MSAAPPVWTEPFTVRAYEAGPGDRASVLTLCDYLQEAAGFHARALGVETFELPGGPGVWVLARLRLEVERLPVWNETVTVETWPAAEDGLRAHRDFVLRGGDGAEIGRAATEWLVLDLGRRRPVRLPPAVRALRPPGIPRALPEAPPPADPAEVTAERAFWVRRSDLDRNAHANNARFVEWALEAVLPSWAEARALAALDVVFRAEATYGERVVSALGPDSGGDALAHRLTRERDGSVLALVRTHWRPA